MISARDEILARVAEAVGREEIDPETEARLTERLHHPPVQLRPQWDDDPVERFVSKLRAVAATVDVVNTAADVAKSIASFLRENDLPPAVVLAPDDRLNAYQPVEKGAIDRASLHHGTYRGEGDFAVVRNDEGDLSDQDGASGGHKREQGAISARHGLFRGAGADELAHQQ